MATASDSKSGKRKRVVLSIDQKIEVLKLIDKGTSYTIIMEKFGIGRSTVANIKKKRSSLMDFRRQMKEMGTVRTVKTMKLSEDPKLDQAVLVWFKQKRAEGIPISGGLLCEKAVELSKILRPESNFKASSGWRWRFCQRHGIRELSLQGEKLDANTDAAKKFVPEFKEVCEKRNLSLNKIFNCDETGLNFRLLPQSTLASSFEKSAAGRKKSKERVTLNVCSNATGTIKLPIHLIGKAKKPRCFKGQNMDLLPVKYSGQTNAWMTSELFHSWFHDDFVPTVRKELVAMKEEPKAVLVLDNCSAHPEACELVSADRNIFAHFLPANVTSLIQPMDQGVLQAIKMRYKKKLLRKLIIGDDLGESIVDIIKSVTMKTVTEFVAEAWREIQPITLRRSWQKIIAMEKPKAPSASGIQAPTTSELPSVLEDALQEGDEPVTESTSPQFVTTGSKGYALWRGIRIRIQRQQTEELPRSDCVEDAQEFQCLFQELGLNIDLGEISDWLSSDLRDTGCETLTDEEICDMVSKPEVEDEDDSEDKEEQLVCPVSHSQAASMFDKCMAWLEHQPEASAYNTSVLRELRTLASEKRLNSLKQYNITDFF